MNAMPPARDPRVVAIVQARMGSTRLPGKVLRTIAGKPLLWHVVHRLRACHSLHTIAVATTTNEADNQIVDFCRGENVTCIRGPEDNVLSRFSLAAGRTKADIIVRVSSDAPFVDAGFIDHLVESLIEQDGDYVMLEPGELCAHEGVDPFSRRALDRLMQEVPDDPVAREHVTGYFKLHPQFVRIVHARCFPELKHNATRLTIDTPDDLAFIETLYDRLHANAGEASLSDLLVLLEKEPALKEMNAHVKQKPLLNRGGLAIIRCDGGGTLGFGHVKRSLAIARALRDREGFGVMFALNGNESAANVLREGDFPTVILPQFGQSNALSTLVGEHHPDILICDARQNMTGQALERLATRVPVTAVIDDSSERRLAATHAYFPPLPQVKSLSWKGSNCAVHAGWEWSVLGFDASGYNTDREPDAVPRIVVSMGGSDPFDMTRLAARALTRVNVPFKARFVIGPGFRGTGALVRAIQSMSPNFEAVEGVSDLGSEFSEADLALVAFGVTAYELAALGVPALYLAITEDHMISASAFETAGMGIVLGLARKARAEDVARVTWQLLIDEKRRSDMRESGLNTIDGRGAERIAADLAAAVHTMRDEQPASASA
jgi:spore coat polysaccharide biosynthesis protein SpsF